jgi:hypothetical protein
MTQKRNIKNLKRKLNKKKLSKFERQQQRIRNKIINDGLLAIQTNLLNNQDKNTQASLLSD